MSVSINNKHMNTLINNSIKVSITYEAYRNLVSELVKKNSTTGIKKTEALANYTKLNDRRMKRWDKTLKVSDGDKNKIKEFDRNVTWLALTESWCGDAAHIIPVFNKIATLNNQIDIKIVFRDENPDLMNAFLTDGNQSIPKLIMIDNDTKEVLNTYGPRPSQATNAVNEFKATHGKLTPEFKEDLQLWYNKDKGQNIIQDIIEMFSKLEPSVYQ